LFAYERLFFELGNRFEPYVKEILPFLLSCYGDPSDEVRDAAAQAAKMIMAQLTGFGIKMVLPIVLAALEEKDWRTKLESIGLLSSMAHAGPQQLSACLPMIVPRLLEVMTDPNAKVQTAAKVALKLIGSTIRNPEILSLAPVLLAALNDPATHTKRALQDLMRTSFVHSVDPPSLALIIPILRKLPAMSHRKIMPKLFQDVRADFCIS
jgi:HEAT repeat protein